VKWPAFHWQQRRFDCPSGPLKAAEAVLPPNFHLPEDCQEQPRSAITKHRFASCRREKTAISRASLIAAARFSTTP
jgi:hypothetical protein